MDAEPKEIPHMVIKKVHKSSQSHMEEFVKQFGADRTYYARSDGDYPFMFVVFTKESSLNRAYVRISEKFSTMYEVSLKPPQPKSPTYCIECMKESFYFCESCSEPYCSESCQRKNWPSHATKCASIPKLVQVQWRETGPKLPTVNPGDPVAILGYEAKSNSVTVRVLDGNKDRQYHDFLEECKEEAVKSPPIITLTKEAKVWALHRDQWYRGKIETVTPERVTVQLLDLMMTQPIAKENLRLLQNKDLFFRPALTKKLRLKGMRSKDVMENGHVRNCLNQIVLKQEKFTATDTTNNYIDLQYDGTPKSLNRHLLNLFERQTGIEEIEEPAVVSSSSDGKTAPVFTVNNISYPNYETHLKKPTIYVFDISYDGITYTANSFNPRNISEMKRLIEQIKSVGESIFPNTPALTTFESLEVNQLCLVKNGKEYERCRYRYNAAFESIDVGRVYEDVQLDQVRLLPRELISQSYLMVLYIDDASFEDDQEMGKKLVAIKNQTVVMEDLFLVGGNKFKCVWKNVQ